MKKVNMALGGLFGEARGKEKLPVPHTTLAEQLMNLKNQGFNVRRR